MHQSQRRRPWRGDISLTARGCRSSGLRLLPTASLALPPRTRKRPHPAHAPRGLASRSVSVYQCPLHASRRCNQVAVRGVAVALSMARPGEPVQLVILACCRARSSRCNSEPEPTGTNCASACAGATCAAATSATSAVPSPAPSAFVAFASSAASLLSKRRSLPVERSSVSCAARSAAVGTARTAAAGAWRARLPAFSASRTCRDSFSGGESPVAGELMAAKGTEAYTDQCRVALLQ